MNPNP